MTVLFTYTKNSPHGRALVMGLMLHSKARSLLEQGNYHEALEVLAMSEVCSPPL